MTRMSATRRAARIAGIYAALAGLWIWSSDSVLELLIADRETIVRYSVFKGWAFVATTTALLMVLTRRSFAALDRSYEALVAKSEALRESEGKLSAIVRTAREGIVTLDERGRIAMINPAAKELLRAGDEEEVAGEELSRFLVTALPAEDRSNVRLAVRDGAGERPVEASSSRLTTRQGELRTVILRDVTDRLAYEAEIERLNRLYAALSAINQAIARASSRDELFRRACAALVEHGGFAAAWISRRVGEDALELAASAGDGLDALELRERLDEEEHRASPSEIAMRTGTAFVSNDMVDDPALASWRPVAERLGWNACGAFPMRVDGSVAGLLDVVAETRDVFKDREVELLQTAAIDLSFALDRLAAEDGRLRAEAVARSERRFSDAMIESMPGILYFYDEAGRFLRWNRNFEVVSGYGGDAIAEMSPLDFFAEDTRPQIAERIEEVFERGESSVEAPFVARDGTETPYLFTGRRVLHGDRRCLVGVGIDISERVEAERALRELAASLERTVAERTEELVVALGQAKAADQLKSAFLATMSHELRTPLNSIIGFTGILLQGLPGPLNEEQAKQLGMVQRSARHLLALINDVLDLSKIESGQLTVERRPFDLAEAIDQAVETMRPEADAKALELSADIEPGIGQIVGDRRRVEQVLLNLLSNAVKFTVRGRVRLDARVDEREGGVAAVIAVTDTGIGVAPQDMDVLFRPFQQIDTGLTREHEGTGLGLTICRRLVELMGGTIEARSEPGVGSVFTVALPLDGSICG